MFHIPPNPLSILVTILNTVDNAKFFGKNLDFIQISKKEEILSFLDSKIKSKEDDPDRKWMRTWNDYLPGIKYFFRWLYNEKLRAEGDESLSSSFLNVLPVNVTFPSILSVLLMIIIYGIKLKSIPQFDI